MIKRALISLLELALGFVIGAVATCILADIIAHVGR